jgi:hypothetical protein
MILRLWSYLDMISLDAGKFMRLLTLVFHCNKLFSESPGVVPTYGTDSLARLCDELEKLCKDLCLPVSGDMARQLAGCKTGRDAHDMSECFLQTIHSEISRKQFFGVAPERIAYFNQAELFGADVFKSFSSANEDIIEAGTCLALERGTACVMHLSKVEEAGLKALATKLGVGPKNDWGKYLSDIDSELQKRYKASGARSPDEQFYAEAKITFDAMRRAWRNPSMHVEKNYSPERAEEILVSVRAFMRHLVEGGISE